jgi:hypothetical protein
MPSHRFWFMNSQIERIISYECLQQIPVVKIGQADKEDSQKILATLNERVGTIADVRPVDFIETTEEDKQKLRDLKRGR